MVTLNAVYFKAWSPPYLLAVNRISMVTLCTNHIMKVFEFPRLVHNHGLYYISFSLSFICMLPIRKVATICGIYTCKKVQHQNIYLRGDLHSRREINWWGWFRIRITMPIRLILRLILRIQRQLQFRHMGRLDKMADISINVNMI